jgi:hypothetical protein
MRAVLVISVGLIVLPAHLLVQKTARNDDAARETLNIALHGSAALKLHKFIPLEQVSACSNQCLYVYSACVSGNGYDCWDYFQDCLKQC